MKILLVEDEQKTADFVCAGLAGRGFEVTQSADGNAGFECGLQAPFDAIVPDIMLPGRDGLSVLKGLREAGVPTPVILPTVRDELGDRIEGIELGADGYLAKPFFVEQLVARIHADELATREFSRLEYLMRAPGQVFTRAQIHEHVWGFDFDPNTNVVGATSSAYEMAENRLTLVLRDETHLSLSYFVDYRTSTRAFGSVSVRLPSQFGKVLVVSYQRRHNWIEPRSAPMAIKF